MTTTDFIRPRTTLRQRLAWRFRNAMWNCRYHAKRWARAWRYGTGRLTEQDGHDMIYEIQQLVGWWPLETFDVEGVLEDALEIWKPHPELEALCRDAAASVANKWSGSGEAAHAARDWATDLVADYAKANGIVLERVDDEQQEEERNAED